MPNWKDYLSKGLNVFLASRCPLCQRSTEGLICIDCQRQIEQCQLINPSSGWQGDLPVFAWGSYQGTLKRAIAALKYNNQPQMARLLGQWLGKAWLSTAASFMSDKGAAQKFIVVPIPLHVARQQQRGYNQAELLAESFCSWTGVALQRQGLQRVQSTEAQFSLSVVQREKNLANAFDLGPGFRKKYPQNAIVLLDDIYTTGATVRSAAQTLRQAGIKVKGVITVAKAQQVPMQLQG